MKLQAIQNFEVKGRVKKNSGKSAPDFPLRKKNKKKRHGLKTLDVALGSF